LEKNVGPALARICDRYFDTCAAALEKLSALIPDGDPVEIRALSHQMKGASSSLGLPGMEHWFRLLEYAARDGTGIPEHWHLNAVIRLEQTRLALKQRSTSPP
jgi:HPt (histidine-containing phosphotransfer) domain-containing protein